MAIYIVRQYESVLMVQAKQPKEAARLAIKHWEEVSEISDDDVEVTQCHLPHGSGVLKGSKPHRYDYEDIGMA